MPQLYSALALLRSGGADCAGGPRVARSWWVSLPRPTRRTCYGTVGIVGATAESPKLIAAGVGTTVPLFRALLGGNVAVFSNTLNVPPVELSKLKVVLPDAVLKSAARSATQFEQDLTLCTAGGHPEVVAAVVGKCIGLNRGIQVACCRR